MPAVWLVLTSMLRMLGVDHPMPFSSFIPLMVLFGALAIFNILEIGMIACVGQQLVNHPARQIPRHHGGGMAHEYRPGMKMYQAVWERDGERVATYAVHAADEADALSTAEAFFAAHPEFNFPRTGATVSVRAITFPLSADDDY